MAKAKIIGTGIYAPGEPIDNAELMKLAGIEFDAAKHEEKLGIRTRHVARLRGIPETAADFAEKAARAALEDAGVDPEDVGLIIVGTDTPEYVSPATAILVQGRLQGGERDTAAYDVGASCASFTIALDQAARVLAGEPGIRHAVVVGVYNMPAHIRPGDAFGWSIFADGAGAVVLERISDSDPSGYITGRQRTCQTDFLFFKSLVLGNACRRGCHKPSIHREHRRFGARSRPDLSENIAQVHFHGVGADEQLLGDFLIARTRRQQAQDLDFTFTQIMRVAHLGLFYHRGCFLDGTSTLDIEVRFDLSPPCALPENPFTRTMGA